MQARFGGRLALPLLEELYDPMPPRRVGILSIAGALEPHADDVASVLGAAGHTVLRRFGRLQPRVGETEPRCADVIEFLRLYGHEYALVAVRSWPDARGAERELVATAVRQHCRVLWIPGPDDPRESLEAAGATVCDGL